MGVVGGGNMMIKPLNIMDIRVSVTLPSRGVFLVQDSIVYVPLQECNECRSIRNTSMTANEDIHQV